MIAQIENHEAIVDSALRDVKETAARAHAQLGRVQRDGQAIRKRLGDLDQQIALWNERAIRASDADQAKAVECLRRKKRLTNEHADLTAQAEHHTKLERQLGDDIRAIEERLGKLKMQRNLLRTRQTRAEALGALHNDDSRLISELDDIFDRWEVKVSEYEYHAHCLEHEDDGLEREFSQMEDDQDLTRELQELVASRQHR
jgi:phage shock protein A